MPIGAGEGFAAAVGAWSGADLALSDEQPRAAHVTIRPVRTGTNELSLDMSDLLRSGWFELLLPGDHGPRAEVARGDDDFWSALYIVSMRFLLLGAALVLGAGCLSDPAVTPGIPDAIIYDAGPPRSTATLAPLQGTAVAGDAVFTKDIFGAGAVSLTVMLTGVVPDGDHGIHIHETPDCSAPDGTSAGPHWNPLGGPEADPAVPIEMQLGELGNITIAGGAGTLTIAKPSWTLGDGATTDVVGHAIILHLERDAGARIACGVTPAAARL